MMALIRPILIVLAAAALFVTGCQITSPSAKPSVGAPSIGALEHRGRRYALRDLCDAEYRQASSDSFVREFDPDTVLATGARREPPTVPVYAGLDTSR